MTRAVTQLEKEKKRKEAEVVCSKGIKAGDVNGDEITGLRQIFA